MAEQRQKAVTPLKEAAIQLALVIRLQELGKRAVTGQHLLLPDFNKALPEARHDNLAMQP